MLEDVSLWAAFSAGLVSFVTPCVLPLVPVYLASLAGPEILESRTNKKRLPIFLHSLSFVIGFSVVFSLWGAAAGLIGATFISYITVIRQVAGGLLIAFGLLMFASLKIPWLNYEKRLSPSLGTTTSFLRSFLIGAVFPVAWIPCTSWALGGILTLAGVSETAWQGASLLAIYSLGLGLPFLVVGVAFDYTIPLLKRVSRYSKWVFIICAVLLITMGILILINKLAWY